MHILLLLIYGVKGIGNCKGFSADNADYR